MRDLRATEGPELDVAAYAARLADRGRVDPSVETLRGLHEAHALTVPFENLDVHLGGRSPSTLRSSSRRSFMSGGAATASN